MEHDWQSNIFKLQSCTDPYQKADVLRSLLGQLQTATACKVLSQDGLSVLSDKYADSYSTVVDSSDEQNGVNNYADAALALCKGHKNESDHWKSGLTLEDVEQLPCVNKLMAAAKAANDALCHPDIRTKPLAADTSLTTTSSWQNTMDGVSHGAFKLFHQEKDSTHHDQRMDVEEYIPQNAQKLFKTSISNVGAPSHFNQQIPTMDNPLPRQPMPPQHMMGLNPRTGLYRHPRNSPSGSPTLTSGGHLSPLYPQQQEDTWRPTGGVKRKAGAFGNSVTIYNNPGAGKGQLVTSSNQPGDCQGFEEEDEDPRPQFGHFKTAAQQMAIDQQRKYGKQSAGPSGAITSASYGTSKRSLGTRRGPSNKFVPPVLNRDSDTDDGGLLVRKAGPNINPTSNGEPVDERLKNIEPKMIELIENEIMDRGPPIGWDDIAGLEYAKNTIKEIVVWPMLRPDIFTGLRGPPKGLLLFGPPGTGKTLIGKCVASQSKSTFFSISASSLTSKWVGEGEKMVRAMFAVARCHQPAVIFIDEIDSLLTQRSDGEHEASRRIKTEFLVQLDGAATGSEDRILVIGATNRPQEIDEAARRRFVKRLYIPLPEFAARRQIVVHLLSQQGDFQLNDQQLDEVCTRADGYSGADMANLCREAALGPIRSMSFGDIEHISADQVRPISHEDFQDALIHVKASVSQKDLDSYIEWNNLYGSGGK